MLPEGVCFDIPIKSAGDTAIKQRHSVSIGAIIDCIAPNNATTERTALGAEHHAAARAFPVSYTHLDVYKRQLPDRYAREPRGARRIPERPVPLQHGEDLCCDSSRKGGCGRLHRLIEQNSRGAVRLLHGAAFLHGLLLKPK